MSNLVKKIKIKKQDGTFTDYIPIGAEASNVAMSDGSSVENTMKSQKVYYKVNNAFSQAKIQEILDLDKEKVIEFEDGNYTFNDTFHLNKNTTLLLNNAVLTFTTNHGFFNFYEDDEFLEYNGNGNIEINGGTIIGGSISFCHAKNISFTNVKFKNSLNDHFMELMALNNLKIDSCSFAGLSPLGRDYVEYVQIDNGTRAAFPHFTDQDNPTYDQTVNKNLLIENCTFEDNGENNEYKHCTSIGMHGSLENKYHENIIIQDCYFSQWTYHAIQLEGTKNVKILNNKFYDTYNLTEETTAETALYRYTAINLKNSNIDILIENNNVDNLAPFVYTYAPDNLIINNNIIKNSTRINDYETATSIIYSKNPITTLSITNNKFIDFVNRGVLRVPEVNTSTGTIEILNNLCSTTSHSDYLFKLYGSETVYFENNTIDLDDLTGALRFSAANPTLNIKNNHYKKEEPGKVYGINSFTGSFENVYGLHIKFGEPNSATLTDLSSTYDYTQFNTLIICVGLNDMTYTQTLILKHAHPYAKLAARNYKIPVVNSSGNVVVADITLNDDKTITASISDGSILYKYLELINE